MSLRRMSAFVICLLALAAGPAGQVLLPADAAAALDALLSEQVERKQVPGLSVAIAFDNRIVYSKGFGMADLEHQVPVTTSTAFRTASLAKPITATAVMTLVQDGKLDLDAPIRRYCTAWPEKHPVITARQLLSHQSGIRHYARRGESSGTTAYFSIPESLELFKDDPLRHEPGTKYLYSTYGFSVLGCAIEGASGTTYMQYVTDRIFKPAGMTRTRQDFHYFVIPDRSRGYMLMTEEMHKGLPPSAQAVAKPGVIYNAGLHDTSMKVPGGGLVSTAEDLARFGIALNTGTLLSEPVRETMWTAQTLASGESTPYGLGWGVTPAEDSIRRLTHSGNQAGAANVLHVVPELGVTVAVTTNLEDYAVGTLSRRIINILREHLGGAR